MNRTALAAEDTAAGAERAWPAHHDQQRLTGLGDHVGELTGHLQSRVELQRGHLARVERSREALQPTAAECELRADLLEDLTELREVARHEQLRLGARDVVVDVDAVACQRQLAHTRLVAEVALGERGQQPGAIQPVVVQRSDQPVLDRPPVQSREPRRLARHDRLRDQLRQRALGGRDLLRRRVALLLHDREAVDHVVHGGVVGRPERAHAVVADPAQEGRVLGVRQDRRVPARFVHDVGRGSVRQVLDAADLGGDRQDAERLELLKRARRDEAVDADRAPAERAQAAVHLGDPRNPLDRHPGLRQAAGIGRVGRALQPVVHLQQNEAPDRLIHGGVRVVVLLHDEPSEMVGDTLSGLCQGRNTSRFLRLPSIVAPRRA